MGNRKELRATFVIHYAAAFFFLQINPIDACQYATQLFSRQPLPHDQSVRAGAAPSSCTIRFQGVSRSFQGCKTNLQGGLNIYWNINSTSIETVFSGRPVDGGYVAWGWGGTQMVGTSATIMFVDPSSSQPTIVDYYLSSKTPSGVRPDNKQGITLKEVELQANGTLVGRFFRSVSKELNASPQTSAIWAVGPKVRSVTTLDQHSHADRAVGSFDLSQNSGNRTSTSANTTSTSTGASPVGGSAKGIFKGLPAVVVIHILMMGISWLIVAPTGIFAMRYLKQYNPLTFRLHRGLMVVLSLGVAIGFGLGLTQGLPSGVVDTTHLALGSVIVGLCLLQVVMGTLRPHKGSTRRPKFNKIHWWSGRSALTLAVINCFLGLKLTEGTVRWYVAFGCITAFWVAVFSVFGVCLRSQFPTEEVSENKDSFWVVTDGSADGQSSHHPSRASFHATGTSPRF